MHRFVARARAAHGGKADPSGGHPVEAVAAANVVDGLRLVRRWQAGPVGPGSHGLPDGGTAEADAIAAELARLTALVDGLSDTMLAEGVHQTAAGRTRAPRRLSTRSRVATPRRRSRVAETRRAGLSATIAWRCSWGPHVGHRVERRGRPRTAPQLEPELEGWVAWLLPDPGEVGCVAELLDAHGSSLAGAALLLRTWRSARSTSSLPRCRANGTGLRDRAQARVQRPAVGGARRGAHRVRLRFDPLGRALTGFPSAFWQAGELSVRSSPPGRSPPDLRPPARRRRRRT